MAKIARKAQKIFASNAINNGVFGSAQLGTKVLSNDPDVLQGLSAWVNGWNDATISGQRLPTLEEMQGIQFVVTRQLAYIFQEGIPEYNATTEYFINSVVKKASTYELYGSVVDNNTGNALTDPTKWVLLVNLANAGGPLNNFAATTAPTVNEDSGDGYSIGSRWVNTTTKLAYQLVDATVGAAVWKLIVLDSFAAQTFMGNIGVAAAIPAAVALSNIIPWKNISGFLPSSIAGTNTTAGLTVSVGQAVDGTNAAFINKASTTGWNVSNGNAINGYEGGTTLPNSSTIHFFVGLGSSGVGVFASTSLTPTFPSGINTYTRRVFSLKTNSSGALLPGTSIEIEGGAQLFYLTTQIMDVNVTNLGGTTTAYTLTVPTGIKVHPLIRALTDTASQDIILLSGDETSVATAGYNTVPGYDLLNASTNAAGIYYTTNTSGQISANAGGSNAHLAIHTRGWIDFRR